MSWRDEAACKDHPRPDVWLDEHFATIAIRICKACPVIEQCAQHAARLEENGLAVHGVVAGLRMEQRVRVPGRRTGSGQAAERRRIGGECWVCGEWIPDSGHGMPRRYCPPPATCRQDAHTAQKRLNRTSAA